MELFGGVYCVIVGGAKIMVWDHGFFQKPWSGTWVSVAATKRYQTVDLRRHLIWLCYGHYLGRDCFRVCVGDIFLMVTE